VPPASSKVWMYWAYQNPHFQTWFSFCHSRSRKYRFGSNLCWLIIGRTGAVAWCNEHIDILWICFARRGEWLEMPRCFGWGWPSLGRRWRPRSLGFFQGWLIHFWAWRLRLCLGRAKRWKAADSSWWPKALALFAHIFAGKLQFVIILKFLNPLLLVLV